MPWGWRFTPPYVAYFLFLGLFMPYWPLWLESRGLDAGQIGVLVALTQLLKIVTPPLVAERADAHGRRRAFLIAAGIVTAATFAFFGLATGFAALALVTIASHLALPVYLPLTEQIAVRAARRGAARYGPVRAVGSLAFIVAALAAGPAVDRWGIGVFYGIALAAALSLPLAAAWLPPDSAPAPRGRARRPSLLPMLALLRRPDLQRLFLAAALLQSSHGLYYALGSLHWQSLGLSGATIGVLWGVGVAAEILYFVTAGRRLAPVNVGRVLTVVGLLGALRWVLTAFVGDPALLMAIQCLHAATYGATHLAVVSYLAHHLPEARGGSAQALYSALPMGLGMALVVGGAGGLYEWLGGQAYVAMAALCLAGAWVGVGFLGRR